MYLPQCSREKYSDDSCSLAAHEKSLGVDAIASIKFIKIRED